MARQRTRMRIAGLLALASLLFLGAAALPGEDEALYTPPAGGGQMLRADRVRLPAAMEAEAHAAQQLLQQAPLLGNSLLIGLCRWDVGPGLFTDWFFCLILRALYGLDGIKRRRSAVNMRSVYN